MNSIGAVVLTYNKSWILRKFWSSLRNQTRPPDRIVVVDDASTDGTQDRLDSLLGQCEVVRLPENKGQSFARNEGFARIREDFLIFLDADVELDPGMLRDLADALDRHPEAAVAYGHFRRCGSRTDDVRSSPWDPAKLHLMNYVSTMSLARRKDLPRPPFDPELRRYEDWDLWLRLAREGKRGVLVDRVLFLAHYRAEDLSGSGESIEAYNRVRKKHGLDPITA